MRVLAFLFSTFFLLTAQAGELLVKGEIFEPKTQFEKKIFNIDIKFESQEDVIKTSAIYKDLQGQVAVEEYGVVKGDKLVSFEIDQKQSQEKGRVQVQGDKILFSYEKNGQKKTAEEKFRGPLLTNANFNMYVANHWQELSSGKEVEVRFAVWFRLETVGFKIFKVGEVQRGSQKLIQLRMKASSFVIAAIVDPLNFWYSEDGKRLVELSGRVSPKTLKSGEFKDLDADVRYL